LTALFIFLGVYLVLAIGRLPGFRIDRTGACIIGASLMIAFGVLDFREAYVAIDYDTIILLFGMMIVVANLRLSGFFRVVAEYVVEHAHRPLVLLGAIVLVAGFFSAFFVNDTMCLVLTPLVLEIARQLRRNPVPYLLAVAMAANVGSVATITGNPQNMMIGSFSGVPYRVFAAALSPVAVIGLLFTMVVIAAVYHREFRSGERVVLERRAVRLDRILLWKSLAVSAGMIVLFFSGWQVSKVALIAGAVLLVTRRVKPEKIYREIDWPLLVLFIGLFIVVAGVDKTSLARDLFSASERLGIDRTWVLSTFAALLSNIVSNVPAVLVFKPFVAHLSNPTKSWLVLAMSTTLAGNLTILGSVANLIVIQRARSEVRIGFWEYFKVGAPLTVLTIAIGVLMLG
jgi:Na+/H+ antiporter NhaD/arsenite permease-like protein